MEKFWVHCAYCNKDTPNNDDGGCLDCGLIKKERGPIGDCLREGGFHTLKDFHDLVSKDPGIYQIFRMREARPGVMTKEQLLMECVFYLYNLKEDLLKKVLELHSLKETK